MNQKAAILIPTIAGREHYLEALLNTLKQQFSVDKEYHSSESGAKFLNAKHPYAVTLITGMFNNELPVEIFIIKDDRSITIGEKRNILTEYALNTKCTHRAFIDDDDMVESNYLALNAPGVIGNYDCNSLVGIYSCNGHTDPNKHIFIHSLKYTSWYEDDKYYYRNPNHLNFIKLDLIKDIQFQHKNEGEDGCWSEELFRLQRLKNEYEITEPFYHYLFRTKAPSQV